MSYHYQRYICCGCLCTWHQMVPPTRCGCGHREFDLLPDLPPRETGGSGNGAAVISGESQSSDNPNYRRG